MNNKAITLGAVVATGVLFLCACPFSIADQLSKREQATFAEFLRTHVDLRRKSDNSSEYYCWLLDENGNQIKDLNCDSPRKFSEGLAAFTQTERFSKKSLAGYIDSNGELAIPPQFTSAADFSEGLAWVTTDSKENGYINRKAERVIRRDDLYEGFPFSDGLAAVRVKMHADEINHEQSAGARLPGKWGYIDRTGKLVIVPKYDQARSFHNGLATVRQGDNWFLIDRKGTVCGGGHSIIGTFNNNLAPVQINGKSGYLNEHGNIAIAPKFEDSYDFNDGLAAVRIGGKFGFIDSHCKFQIEPRFQAVDHFSEGLCAVRDPAGKWSFIDKTGKVQIAGSYDDVEAFSSGRALVKVNDKFGFIDHAGNYTVEPRYDLAFSFSNNRAIVAKRNWNDPYTRTSLLSAHLYDSKIHADFNSATGVYIPKDLADALRELDAMLPAAAKEDIKIIEKSEMIVAYQDGFGTWLRNSWGLWKSSRLANYFTSIGIQHPNDMSATILDCYWSKVHGDPKYLTEPLERFKPHSVK